MIHKKIYTRPSDDTNVIFFDIVSRYSLLAIEMLFVKQRHRTPPSMPAPDIPHIEQKGSMKKKN